jgi:hypothetical protein
VSQKNLRSPVRGGAIPAPPVYRRPMGELVTCLRRFLITAMRDGRHIHLQTLPA